MLHFQESRQSARDSFVDMSRGRRLLLWSGRPAMSWFSRPEIGLTYTVFLVTAGPRRTAVNRSMACIAGFICVYMGLGRVAG
jgi:hypothetical protein